MFSKVLIFPTFRCSMTCPSCLRRPCLRDSEYITKDMSFSEFLVALESIKKQTEPIRSITFSGGEVTMWPFLKRAIHTIKQYTDFRVRVCTNAVKRTSHDYGEADEIIITNYGAINRYYIYHLKKTFPGKVTILNAVHIPYPFPDYEPTDDVLPANCTCLASTIVRDRVYACGMKSGFADSAYKSLDSQWLKEFKEEKDNIIRDNLCKTCLVNRNIRSAYQIPVTVELCAWEIGSIMHSFKSTLPRLRAIYRSLIKKKRGF